MSRKRTTTRRQARRWQFPLQAPNRRLASDALYRHFGHWDNEPLWPLGSVLELVWKLGGHRVRVR